MYVENGYLVQQTEKRGDMVLSSPEGVGCGTSPVYGSVDICPLPRRCINLRAHKCVPTGEQGLTTPRPCPPPLPPQYIVVSFLLLCYGEYCSRESRIG